MLTRAAAAGGQRTDSRRSAMEEVTGLNWIVVDTKRKRSKMALKISAQRHN